MRKSIPAVINDCGDAFILIKIDIIIDIYTALGGVPAADAAGRKAVSPARFCALAEGKSQVIVKSQGWGICLFTQPPGTELFQRRLDALGKGPMSRLGEMDLVKKKLNVQLSGVQKADVQPLGQSLVSA